MRNKIFKIALVGAIGTLITFATLATLTRFVLLPSIVVGGLLTLAAMAAYLPPRGLPLVACIPTLFGVFFTSLFLASPAFSGTPHSRGSMLIPILATAVTFTTLTACGYRGFGSRNPTP